MSIYTKSGDKGETGLLGGKRISKTSLRIEAIGNIDELNAALGVLCTTDEKKKQEEILIRIQNDLFTIGTEIAHIDNKITAPIIKDDHVKFLEARIDELETKLPKLKNFILPGGTPFAAQAHVSRAVCRRAERNVITLYKKEPINNQIIIYLNRLSDLLFMLAREDMFEKNVKEIPWKAP